VLSVRQMLPLISPLFTLFSDKQLAGPTCFEKWGALVSREQPPATCFHLCGKRFTI